MAKSARQKRDGEILMLRTSPHNEEFILKAARNDNDLSAIAEGYLREIFDGLKSVTAEIHWEDGTLEMKYDLGDGDVQDKMFYITSVELL